MGLHDMGLHDMGLHDMGRQRWAFGSVGCLRPSAARRSATEAVAIGVPKRHPPVGDHGRAPSLRHAALEAWP